MSSAEIHREPFIHLVDLAWDRVLIAWGAFYFERTKQDRWEIIDDEQLASRVGRHTCIGASAEPFGRTTVQVLAADGTVAAEAATDERAWVWVQGLEPDTDYRYRVVVDGVEWAAAELWDWVPRERGGYDLAPAGRRYDLRFRTWPHPDGPTPPVRFVALGDYGVGIRADVESSRRQRRIADVLERLIAGHDVRFVVSLGDNIYRASRDGSIRKVGERTTTGIPASSSRTGSRSRGCRCFRPSATMTPPTPRAATIVPRWRTTSTFGSASITVKKRRR